MARCTGFEPAKAVKHLLRDRQAGTPGSPNTLWSRLIKRHRPTKELNLALLFFRQNKLLLESLVAPAGIEPALED